MDIMIELSVEFIIYYRYTIWIKKGDRFMDNYTMTQMGFQAADANYYFKEIDGIFTAVESAQGEYRVISYCAFPYMGGENELNNFLIQQSGTGGTGYGTAYYNNGNIEVRYLLGGNVQQEVTRAINIIFSGIRQYNMLSSCMCCGKAGYTNVSRITGKVGPVCGTCEESYRRQQMNSQMNVNNLPNSNVIQHPVTDKGPLLITLFAGAGGGLVGAVLWVLRSFVGKLSFAAGIAAGAIAAGVASRLDYAGKAARVLIAVVISLIIFSIGIYIGIGVDIYVAFKNTGITFGEAMQFIPTALKMEELASAIRRDTILGILSFFIGVVLGVVLGVFGKRRNGF